MSVKKIAIIIIVIAAPIIGLQSCYKVATLYPDINQEVTTEVSFANDIIPVFNAKCSMSGCHNAGGQKPNLVAESALNSLTNGGYIDVDNPENSELYLWMTGKKATAMPQGEANNPSNINQYVLAWIKQGAQNN